MVEIRRCTVKDVPTLVEMMVVTTNAHLPGMRSDRKKMIELIRRNISDRSSIILVADEGFLLAIERPFIWFEKRHTQILLIGSETTEICIALVAACLEWWQERRASLLIMYSSPKITLADNVLLEAGFECTGTMLLRRKYNGPKSE